MVAEMPQILNPPHIFLRRDRASSICTPRLVPSNSCHSSTTMALQSLKIAAYPLVASRSCRLSGVVIRRSGISFFCLFLSTVEVSPVRIPTVSLVPRSRVTRSADCLISRERALNGVIQIALSPFLCLVK